MWEQEKPYSNMMQLQEVLQVPTILWIYKQNCLSKDF